MSISPGDEGKLFDAKALARQVHSAVNQGFVAAEDAYDPYGRAFSQDDLARVESIVADVIKTLHVKVKEERKRGYTQVILYRYSVLSSRNFADERVDQAACERLLAAINANPDLRAWVEGASTAWLDGRHCHLVLDFSRMYATLLTSQVPLDSVR